MRLCKAASIAFFAAALALWPAKALCQAEPGAPSSALSKASAIKQAAKPPANKKRKPKTKARRAANAKAPGSKAPQTAQPAKTREEKKAGKPKKTAAQTNQRGRAEETAAPSMRAAPSNQLMMRPQTSRGNESANQPQTDKPPENQPASAAAPPAATALPASPQAAPSRKTKKNGKRRGRQKPKKKPYGVRILKLKAGGALRSMGLRPNDVILKINKTKITSGKRFSRIFKRARKKGEFQISIQRGGKTLHWLCSVEKKIKCGARPSENKKTPKSFFEKHRKLLQKAYVTQTGTLVYSHPHFDSRQLDMIPYGRHITISKKILRPLRGLGSFYKVFIEKPRKLAGYVSEVEVAPEFLKKEGRLIPNPQYAMMRKRGGAAARRGQTSGGKNRREAGAEPHSPQKEQTQAAARSSLKRALGAVLGRSFKDINSSGEWLMGLAWSGGSLSASPLRTDAHLLFNKSLSHAFLDLTAAYPVAQGPGFDISFGFGGRAGFQTDPKGVDFDLLFSLSARRALFRNVILTLSLKLEGLFQKEGGESQESYHLKPHFSPQAFMGLSWGF